MNQDVKASKFMSGKKAQGTIGFVIGIAILVIVVAQVALPLIAGAVSNNSDLTATQVTLLTVSGTLLIVLVISLIARAVS